MCTRAKANSNLRTSSDGSAGFGSSHEAFGAANVQSCFSRSDESSLQTPRRGHSTTDIAGEGWIIQTIRWTACPSPAAWQYFS
mmetsp:Transcript_89556/g.196225  ORF Transcript_89556/g.196225 Transcript_89556/m.196225 type:complete len:83 (+) Transcript_89556:344-592(+)